MQNKQPEILWDYIWYFYKKKEKKSGHQRHSFTYAAAPRVQPGRNSWPAAAEDEEDEDVDCS